MIKSQAAEIVRLVVRALPTKTRPTRAPASLLAPPPLQWSSRCCAVLHHEYCTSTLCAQARIEALESQSGGAKASAEAEAEAQATEEHELGDHAIFAAAPSAAE